MTLFRVVYAVLALNFIVPTLGYAFAPEQAMATFSALNQLLGGGALPAEQSVFWWVLGVANVGTLGFGCALVWWDVRRWHPAVAVVAFLKAFDAVDWGVAWARWHAPAYGAATLLDLVTVYLIWSMPRRALRELGERPR